MAAGRPRRVAVPGAGAEASVAVDPASDRALAAWRSPAAGRIEYAVSRGMPAYRPLARSGEVRAPGGGAHWLRITAAALAALAVLAAIVVAWRRHARRQPAGG